MVHGVNELVSHVVEDLAFSRCASVLATLNDAHVGLHVSQILQNHLLRHESFPVRSQRLGERSDIGCIANG